MFIELSICNRVFSEWKEKVDIVDHDKNDSVSFHMKNTWYFDPDRSGSLTLDTTVAVPHIAMLVSSTTWRVGSESVSCISD